MRINVLKILRFLLYFLILFFLYPSIAGAEGVGNVGANQRLYVGTTLYVDILNSTTETFVWTGRTAINSGYNPSVDVSVQVTDPNGNVLGTYASGATINPPDGVNGSYKIEMTGLNSLDVLSNYDVTVSPTPSSPSGRLYSLEWVFNAASYGIADKTDTSFYAIVNGGSSSDDTVVELKLEGLAGWIYQISANDTGVNGSKAGRSVDLDSNDDNADDGLETVTPEFRIYLSPPSVSIYSTVTPEIDSFAMQGVLKSGEEAPIENCAAIVPGVTTAKFKFSTTVTGRHFITCDLNADGIFDFSSDNDVTLMGDATVGNNSVTWDGKNNTGSYITPGTYNCKLLVSVGNFHYVGRDVETSFPGLRMFMVDSSLAKTPLAMYWNDTSVYGTLGGSGRQDAVYFDCNLLSGGTCPSGNYSLMTSGASGIDSGNYTDTVSPNANSRAWGNFNAAGTSQGNLTLLDTYAFIESAEFTTIRILAPENEYVNSDADDLPDFSEVCTYGTDPNDCDTDDDCLCDDTEVNRKKTDPNDVDTDDDGLQDGTEVGQRAPELAADTDMTVCIPDEDADTVTDPLDSDTDNDLCIDGTGEDISGNGMVDIGELDPNNPDCAYVQGGGLTQGCGLVTPPREAASGRATGLHLLGLLFPPFFWLAGRMRRKRGLLSFLVAFLLWAHPLFALNTQVLRPHTLFLRGYQLFTSDLLPKDRFAFDLHINYARRPFEVATAAGGAARMTGIVDDFVTNDFLFSYGANERLNLNIDIPFNTFHNIAPTYIPTRDKGFVDMGDPLINAKIQIIDPSTTEPHMGLAVVPFLTLPLGRESIHFGDESVMGGLWAAGDVFWESHLFYLNLGTRFRHETEHIVNLAVGHEFLFGLGYQRPFIKKWKTNFAIEFFGSTTYGEFLSEEISTPIEGLVVFEKKCLGHHPFALTAGGGLGVTAGYGTPNARGLVGISYLLAENNPCKVKPPPPPPPPPAPEAPMFIRLKEKVHFYTDKSDIKPRSYPTLDDVVRILNEHPEIVKVQIEGHTDSRMPVVYNQGLSERRAKSVYDYLVGKGISPKRLTWIGYGEERPIATNDTVEGRAKNRRTVLKVLEVDYDMIPKEEREKRKKLYEGGETEFGHEEITYEDT